MLKPKKLCFSFRNLVVSIVCSFLVMGAFWLLCSGLHKLGCPFPTIKMDKFSDLGFFALSNFSFITFLALIPFQAAEGELSPGFFASIINRLWSHFGLYVLLSSFISCFIILSCENRIPESMNGQLFFSIVGSVIFAVVFHLVHTLRYLYQPLIVYENIIQLADEESGDEVWLDLYECTIKAIKANRVGNARSFIDLMNQVYKKLDVKGTKLYLQKDLQSLYKAAQDLPPLAKQIEKNWPFLRIETKMQGQNLSQEEPLSAKLASIIQ